MLWPLLESVPNTRVLTSGEEDVSQDVSAALQNFIMKMFVKDFTQNKDCSFLWFGFSRLSF